MQAQEVISLLPQQALDVLVLQLQLARDVPGDVAEVGVYKGGSAYFLARCSAGKAVHLFDTFCGLPEPGKSDWHKAGEFSDTDLKSVKRLLSAFPNVVFHAGLFQDTSPEVEDKRWSFVHLDGDLYETTVAGLEFFYPRMSKGGIIALDDFMRPTCPGVAKAVSEFLGDKPERVEVVGDPRRCQARIVKL